MASPIIALNDVSAFYPGKRYLFKKPDLIQALHSISFSLYEGEILAVVGESGSGKSTLGRSMVGLVQHIKGDFYYNDSSYDPLEMDALRSEIQIIFQDALSSLNPRMKIGNTIKEVIRLYFPEIDDNKRMIELLQKVDLPLDVQYKYPFEISGGQRQRACIARSLAVEPRILICDEIVSALDVSVQAKLLNLLLKLVKEDQLSLLFTTHDLHVVEAFADRLIVMRSGRIVEEGEIEKVFNEPESDYTHHLLNSIPEKV